MTATLAKFLRATDNFTPTLAEVLRYSHPRQLSMQQLQELLQWQRSQEEGETETLACAYCWAVTVTDAESEEGLAFNTCEDCYRTICEFCHQHTPEEPHRCLCGDCATGTPSNPGCGVASTVALPPTA